MKLKRRKKPKNFLLPYDFLKILVNNKMDEKKLLIKVSLRQT